MDRERYRLIGNISAVILLSLTVVKIIMDRSVTSMDGICLVVAGLALAANFFIKKK